MDSKSGLQKRFAALFTAFALVVTMIPATAFAKTEPAVESKPLAGKTISIMGDSISTYTGWSDVAPIIDAPGTEICGRTGEAYYGPAGGDFHNTDMLVTDTWWHQAATELGAEVLVSNASNSTGLLCASYPSIPEWEEYLEARLMYKSRPYYLGKDGKNPDIIALYVGSNEAARASGSQFGSVEAVDFDTLIVENSDGTYTYAEPVTVAEAYCILLHKVSVTYPDAEIYCFKVVPSAGGPLKTCNQRLESAHLFNNMVDGVAEHYGAEIVDLMNAFGLDPDSDGIATEEDFNNFKTYYHEDPHPNAKGFDVITECFVDTVLGNSKYVVEVETAAGNREYVGVKVSETGEKISKTAKKYVTENGMIVDFKSYEHIINGTESTYSESYTSKNQKGTYEAKGGAESKVKKAAPEATVDIPLIDKDDAQTENDETAAYAQGMEPGVKEQKGDLKKNEDDGVYDYRIENIIKQGSVTIKTHSICFSEKIQNTDDEEKTYVKNNTVAAEGNDIVMGLGSVDIPQKKEDVPEISDGYKYIYLGSDQYSHFYACFTYTSPAKSSELPAWEDGDDKLYVRRGTKVFKDRGLVVPKVYLEDRTVEKESPAWWAGVQNFMLSDGNANVLSTYCADRQTPAVPGFCYNMVNLEDATYYSKTEAEMIRTVVNNGYWGTDYGFGSLAELKKKLKTSGEFSEDEINSITDGIAMTATQYAVWTYSNYMDDTKFISAYYIPDKDSYDPIAAEKAGREDSAALVMKLYYYLVGLEPATIEDDEQNTQNTIINEKNFVEKTSITVKDKPEKHKNNKDSDETNDVYLMDVSFKLEVKPVENNGDSLVMRIEDENGKLIAAGRIAGKLEKDEIKLKVDENGIYTFEDIVMEEGFQNISFVLEGIQNLEKAPHLFVSENRDGETSQTMVGIVEGAHSVNVTMDISYEINVDDEIISTEHIWRTEKNKPRQPWGKIRELSGNR